MQNLYQVKQEICAIGDRIYKRGYAAGNDGNISFRISENEVVCTPTMISKGFMTPDDLCVVDMNGNQLSGKRKATSEIRLHLAVMKERPEVKSVVHCHPPFATAFGMAREPIPPCALPEVEIHLGEVPIAQYAIPGGQKFADTILPFVHKTKIVVLANHGTVSWGETPERAYWWTEILDAYCHMLILAKSIGNVGYFSKEETEELMALKKAWGGEDPRFDIKNCDLCSNDVFRDSWSAAGLSRHGFNPPSFAEEKKEADPADEKEALIAEITRRVVEALKK